MHHRTDQNRITRLSRGLHVFICLLLPAGEKNAWEGKLSSVVAMATPQRELGFWLIYKKKKIGSTDLRLQTSANKSIVLDSCREIGFKKQHFSSETVWHRNRSEDAKNFCEASASKQARGHLLG